MNKPVLRSSQMKNINSFLLANSTLGTTTMSLRNPNNDYNDYIETIRTKLQYLKKLQKIIQDKLPNLGLLEPLNFKIVNDLKKFQQLDLPDLSDLPDLQPPYLQPPYLPPNLQPPDLQQQQYLSIIRNIKLEDDEKISSMLNDLKELTQKLEQFPKEMNLISQLIALETVTNKIETEIIRLQSLGVTNTTAIYTLLQPYYDQQNNLTSETRTLLTELNLSLELKSNDVLDTLPTEIQDLVKRINSYRLFIV